MLVDENDAYILPDLGEVLKGILNLLCFRLAVNNEEISLGSRTSRDVLLFFVISYQAAALLFIPQGDNKRFTKEGKESRRVVWRGKTYADACKEEPCYRILQIISIM